ncbi:hypothetical protein Glove_123g100 [Diversispora epigaea]|uniref:Uncharacterized protein n=1 Tax=Diversispora epigaea TaxID=1348612 RepID=A0A397J2F2_9GLOM|nr:hypothetical protein Glove_123g100 [Diversispora epigaea]
MYFQYFELLPSESWSLPEYFSLITQKYKNAKRRIFFDTIQIINIAKNLLDNQVEVKKVHSIWKKFYEELSSSQERTYITTSPRTLPQDICKNNFLKGYVGSF